MLSLLHCATAAAARIVLLPSRQLTALLTPGCPFVKAQRLLDAVPINPVSCCSPLLLPHRLQVNKGAWASWNFLGESATSTDASSEAAVTVSYWLNRLQHLPAEAPQMFVTLNPPHPPAADKVIRRLQLAHPVYRCVLTQLLQSAFRKQ
jgi:predicted NAD/FAD-binding protein